MANNTSTDTTMAEPGPSISAATLTKPQSTPLPSTVVEKPIPYTYTLSHLCITDSNPLPPSKDLIARLSTTANQVLQSTARDAAQSLLNTLLTTCPIVSTPDGPTITLTPSTAAIQNTSHPLPRRLALPKPKPPTKWEQFARRKGVGKYNTSQPQGYAENRKNQIYDEATGEWKKKWGYKGTNKNGDNDWLVELDDKQVRKEKSLNTEQTIRGEGRRGRVERMRRQERKQKSNERKAGRGGGAGRG